MHAPWYRDRQLLALVAFVLVAYFSRMTALPIRAEETRRAMVAREILWTGDWIVPRQQDEPFLSRPPVGSYPIALAAMICGDTTLLATRLPTALATLLTTLLVYGYARQFLSPTGALGAGLSYATMGQVLQLGQLAESEATFTLCVAGSLLVWHWGYMQGWPKLATWSLAYLFVAAGALVKGPQAPVYFAAAVGVYLLWRRDWRAIFHPAHFAGIGLFAALVGAWQIPFARRVGWEGVREVWAGDVGLRFVDETWLSLLEHLALFPLEIAVCLLPSSLLLVAYFRPAFWRGLQDRAPWIGFLVIALAVTFPTCWFVPGAKPRYFMPLYPCLAVLAGVVVDEVLRDASRAWLVGLWRNYQGALAGLAISAGVAVIVLAVWPQLPWPNLRQTPAFAGMFALACAGVAWALSFSPKHKRGVLTSPREITSGDQDPSRALRAVSDANIRRTLWASAALACLFYTGLIVNVSCAGSEDVSAEIAALKSQLPHDAKLASFGLVETMFTYHYAEPVMLLSGAPSRAALPADLDYFCINARGGEAVELPFAWREVAVISADRWKRNPPQRVVIVGQVMPESLSPSPLAKALLSRSERRQSGEPGADQRVPARIANATDAGSVGNENLSRR